MQPDGGNGQKVVRVSLHDHENIMEEMGRRDRLKYDNEEESKDDDSASNGE